MEGASWVITTVAQALAPTFDVFQALGYTVVVLGNYDRPAVMPVVIKIRELLSTTPIAREFGSVSLSSRNSGRHSLT
jgi:hypothetical protein